ncbi:acetylcholine receptor subunit beta-like 1 [Caerostris extrusa]|uniref:Acetylcholine receptor subunit beta-like 1 n=1 Tax=Caerostris extrusa TaxID=172846 RepID=A0AAV4MXT6_CAEEX|nr:acetylcholine receptor subunit beta-like 1 [Caerostris extrusa]
MKFGSWTFNGDQVSLKLYNDNHWVDLSDYWKSGTWGHRGGARIPQRLQQLQVRKGHRNRHLFLHHYTQDAVLHREPDPADGADLTFVYPGVLPARGGRREVTLGISILPVARRLPAARSQDPAPTARAAPHRKVPALHLPHEHRLHLVTVIIINWNWGPRTHRYTFP